MSMQEVLHATAILNLSKMHEADSKIMWTMYSCYQEQLAHAYTATFVTSICNSPWDEGWQQNRSIHERNTET